MKKLLLIASALLAFSFFGCEQPSNSSTSDTGKSDVVDKLPDDSTGGDETTGGEETPTPEPTELVIFDPATYDGDTVEIDGEVFAVITVDGYSTTIEIDPLDCSSVSKFKAKLCAPEANANFNLTAKIADKDNADISSISLYGLVKEPTLCEAGFAKQESWNTVSETKLAAILQPMVQDSTANYAAQSGVVVYVGKITAE